MKTSLLRYLFFLLIVFPFCSRAQFSGDFAFGNWSLQNNVGGEAVSNSATSITLRSPDGGEEGELQFSIVLPEASIISFDWSYSTNDIDIDADAAFYLCGNSYQNVSWDGSGHEVTAAGAGQLLSFYLYSSTGTGGAGNLTITNFSVEPATTGSTCSLAETATGGVNNVPATSTQAYWYTYTMPQDPGKRLMIAADDRLINVYFGACNSPTDINYGYNRLRSSEATAGQQVWIGISTNGTGNFSWNLSVVDTGPGDGCDIPLQAVLGENELPPPDGEKWYTYTMPPVTEQNLVIRSESSVHAWIYTGTCDDLEYIDFFQGELSIPNVPGREILFRWDNNQEENVAWTLSLEGDPCLSASQAAPGQNVTTGAPQWFQYRMPVTGDLTVSSVGLATNDTYLRFYDACGGNQIAYSDDYADLQSEITYSFDAGTFVFILWDDTYSSAGFNWQLSLSNLQQDIQFPPLVEKAVNSESFELSAAASSGLPVTYYSSNPAVASVSGTTVTIHAVGTTTITASQAGNSQYLAAADVEQILVVKQGQTISFNAIPTKYLNSGSFEVTATSDSGLPVYLQSSNPAVATLVGSTVTVHTLGTTTITATQPGDATYASAAPVERILTVERIPQQITFEEIPAKFVNGGSFDVTPSSDSGLPVVIESSNTSVATVSGNTITIVAAGSTTITASQAGDETYAPASVGRVLVVKKLEQHITFNEIPPKLVTSESFNVSPSSNSGLPISLHSSNPAVATVSGNTVTIVAAGTTVLTASQAGNNLYAPAENVARTLTVNKLSQSILFTALPPKTFGEGNFEISASATSGLTVAFASNNPSVASVSGNMISIHGAGSVKITASQSGNDQYSAAPAIEQMFSVGKATQSITFPVIGDRTFPQQPFQLSAFASSGVALMYYSSDEAVATVSGQTVTVHAPGSVTISAEQPGNVNYLPATPVARTFCIKPPKPVVESNFANPEAPILTSSSSTGNEWYRNNVLIQGSSAPSLVVATAGEYTTATVSKNCRSEFSETFVVLITSISDEQEVSLFPNPGNNFITVRGVTQQSELTIYSSTGMQSSVKPVSADAGSVTVDISDLPAGTHYLLARNTSHLRILKFVKL